MRLELREITKRFPGVSATTRSRSRPTRQGARPARRERRRQDDADEHPVRASTSRTRARSSSTARSASSPIPSAAIHAGVGMVHQHFMLVPVFDVVEAVALGAETVNGPLGTFDRAAARKRIVELSEQYNLDVDPDARIESLPVGVRQRVEILKALYRHSDILVLDEPSAVLTPHGDRGAVRDHPLACRPPARPSSSSPTSSTRSSRSPTRSSCCAAAASPARQTRRPRRARSSPT